MLTVLQFWILSWQRLKQDSEVGATFFSMSLHFLSPVSVLATFVLARTKNLTRISIRGEGFFLAHRLRECSPWWWKSMVAGMWATEQHWIHNQEAEGGCNWIYALKTQGLPQWPTSSSQELIPKGSTPFQKSSITCGPNDQTHELIGASHIQVTTSISEDTVSSCR